MGKRELIGTGTDKRILFAVMKAASSRRSSMSAVHSPPTRGIKRRMMAGVATETAATTMPSTDCR